jgi:hypothetical protein
MKVKCGTDRISHQTYFAKLLVIGKLCRTHSIDLGIVASFPQALSITNFGIVLNFELLVG